MPFSHRAPKLRSDSVGRTRLCASSLNSYPSSRHGLPKRRSYGGTPIMAHRVLGEQLAGVL
eukprot:2500228-Alexandrium_andersonii.AAC.1